MMTMATRDRLVKARDEAAALAAPAAVQVAPAPIRVNALDWATAILGRYAAVADERQRQHANFLLNGEELVGLKITPVGPDFDELDARLVALKAPAVAEVAPIVEAPAALSHPFSGVARVGASGKDRRVERATVLPRPGDDVALLFSTDRGPIEVRASRSETVALARRILETIEATAESEPDSWGPWADESWATDAPTLAESLGIDQGVIDRMLVARPGDRTIGDAIREAEAGTCCPADEPTPCLGCAEVSHGFADEVIEAIRVNDAAEDEVVIPVGAVTVAEIAEANGDPLAEWTRPARKPRTIVEPTPRPIKPAPLPDGSRFTLLELIEAQVAVFRGQGNPVFDLMADRLADLAGDVKATGANSVAELADRLPVLTATRDDILRDEGFQQGLDSCPCGA